LLVHLLLSIILRILITQCYLLNSLCYCKNMNCALVRWTRYEVWLLVKGNRVNLSLVTASSNFLQRSSILCWEESDQGSLVTGCCQKSAWEVQGYAWERWLMRLDNLCMIFLIDSYFDLALLLIWCG
jgi:hypothetical protein